MEDTMAGIWQAIPRGSGQTLSMQDPAEMITTAMSNRVLSLLAIKRQC